MLQEGKKLIVHALHTVVLQGGLISSEVQMSQALHYRLTVPVKDEVNLIKNKLIISTFQIILGKKT